MSDSFLMIHGFHSPFLLGDSAQILSVHILLCFIQLLGFPGDTGVKNLLANAGDTRDAGSIPGSGRCPGGGHGTPPQYPCLENPRDRGAWQAAVPGVAESQARLSTHPSRAGTSPSVT